MFKKNYRKIQIEDPDEWNKLIERVDYCTTIFDMAKEEDKATNHSLMTCSYYTESPKYIKLTTRWGFNMLPTTYIFVKNGDKMFLKSGSEEYAIQKRAFGEYLPDLTNDPILNKLIRKSNGKFANKVAGIQTYNPKYNHKAVYCYQYDLNSAYLAQMYNKIPDTRTVKDQGREVRENEIGFIFDENLTLVDKPGRYADIIFDLIDSPDCVKKYCERWFERKRLKWHGAKHQIVDAIGYMQYKNPYMRSYVVHKCNYYITSLIDDNTILSNTDAIYSTVPRDLELGTGLGQWKLSEGIIEIDGLNYKSEAFGDVQRGKLKNLKYKSENRKVVEI